MEQEASTFLEKFIASLCIHGVNTIPFSGNEFQNGISAVEKKMREEEQVVQFDGMTDMFIKVPVEETYQQIRTMFMDLNGRGIGFSGAVNPLWEVMTIKMTPYKAYHVLHDTSILDIDVEIIDQITEAFCDAAGVDEWEAS